MWRYFLIIVKLIKNYNMLKVSFDFDGTLTRRNIKEYARSLVARGFECWIVTSRMGFGKEPRPDWNDDLFNTAAEIGILPEHIHFCCMDNKANFLNGKGFIFHIDDDMIELSFVETDSDCKPICCFGNHTYISECENAISLYNVT